MYEQLNKCPVACEAAIKAILKLPLGTAQQELKVALYDFNCFLTFWRFIEMLEDILSAADRTYNK